MGWVSRLRALFGWRRPAAPSPAPASSHSARGREIRVTTERDGELLNRTYSYWSTAYMENVQTVTLFVGHADGQPRFFRVNLDTQAVTRLGPLLGYQGTAEGWYWDLWGRIYLCDGPRLRRVNPFTGDDTVVMDVSGSSPTWRLWQAHSSDDGTVHCATVQQVVADGAYPKIGTVVQHRGALRLYAAEGVLDESHVTADGRFLLIEEDDGNRIIELDTARDQRLSNAEGALSHLDCGNSFAIGEDDQRGACTYLDLRTMERRVLFETWNQGVVSVKGGRCVVTDGTQIRQVALNGSGVTPLLEHGMQGSGYDFTARASLDPSGRVLTYLSNKAGRMDAYLYVL